MTISRQNFTSFLLRIMRLIVCAAGALGGMRKLQQNDKKFNYFLYAAVNILTTEVFCPFLLVHSWTKRWKRILKLERGWQMPAYEVMPEKAIWLPGAHQSQVLDSSLTWLGTSFGYLPTKWNCLHSALRPMWLLLYRNGFAAFMTLFLTPSKLPKTREAALTPPSEVWNMEVYRFRWSAEGKPLVFA